MIKSMTAYARADSSQDGITIATEIRSYNSRHLDIALRLSQNYLPLEERVKKLVARHVARGRVEINIQIKEERDEAVVFEVDLPKARAYHSALEKIAGEFELETSISLDHVLGAHGIIRPGEVALDLNACWASLEKTLTLALQDLDAMRCKEGAFMAADISARLATIEEKLVRIQDRSDDLLPLYQERLTERIGVLTKGLIEIEPERIAQEAAILADKSDISEEIVRAQSHIVQFRDSMAADQAAGRKLNFLLQEFNREFNTMGSKTGKAKVAHMIVEVKAEIEKLREQVQNIE
jgi:uncharacterized protein (TIGR00255 family)